MKCKSTAVHVILAAVALILVPSASFAQVRGPLKKPNIGNTVQRSLTKTEQEKITKSDINRFTTMLNLASNEYQKAQLLETVLNTFTSDQVSRLTLASHLKASQVVTADDIVLAARWYPAILREYLPELKEPERTIYKLYDEKLYNDMTFPIILEYAQKSNTSIDPMHAASRGEFGHADDIIATFGMDINYLFKNFVMFESIVAKGDEFNNAMKFFVERHVDFNQLPFADDKLQRTITHFVVARHKIDVLPYLQKKGVDIKINAQDINGDTPLHILIKNTNRFVSSNIKKDVEQLLKLGANPAIRNNDGFDAMDLLRQKADNQTAQEIYELLKHSFERESVRYPVHF